MENEENIESQEHCQSDEADGYACKHENYDIKTVMDFSFYVCTECGYQWKA
ncbi:MAG: hypothetical protein GY718_18565 [Lentisphaerae bacterium]|nr:hypothetical protein [Lentisphaerota bacterium]